MTSGNQPATDSAVTTPSGSGWRQWSVTSAVQSMYTAANHGFLTGTPVRTASALRSNSTAPDNPP